MYITLSVPHHKQYFEDRLAQLARQSSLPWKLPCDRVRGHSIAETLPLSTRRTKCSLPCSLQHRACSHVYLVCMHSITYSTSLSFLCFFLFMKANFKASTKQNHLIHYRSEYRPLQNPLWDISVPTMRTMMRKNCDIIE